MSAASRVGAGFVWFAHQPASARWLKSELARLHPELRFAFSRPGLTTFRDESAPSDSAESWPGRVLAPCAAPLHGDSVDPRRACPTHVALAWGVSLGRLELLDAEHPQRPDLSAFAELIAAPLAHESALAQARSDATPDELVPPLPCLHVFERAGKRPVDEEDKNLRGRHALGMRAAIIQAYGDWFAPSPIASRGQLVVDVILPHGADPLEPPLVGVHRHDAYHGPHPGGAPPALLSAAAPSRAYAKLVEAVAFAGIELACGDTALEIGCAPGGAVLAFLERGVDVVGIDPAQMNAALMSPATSIAPVPEHAPRWGVFRHLQCPAAEVERAQLPPRVDWIALDVNMAPMIALKYVERFAAIYRDTLRGVLLTLKIHDDGVLEALPGLRRRIEKLGMSSVAVTQLPSHRHEVAAIGLTSRAHAAR